MEDKQIIELYFARDELAVSATQEKYGGLLSGIALKILGESRYGELSRPKVPIICGLIPAKLSGIRHLTNFATVSPKSVRFMRRYP